MVFSLILSLAIPTNSVFAEEKKSDNERVLNALEGNFDYKGTSYVFDRDEAIQDGLTSEEADIVESINIEQDGISLMFLPAIPPAVMLVVKAAAVGGAAAIGAAFAVDVYKTSTYAACQKYYGEVGVIDTFCEANDHV